MFEALKSYCVFINYVVCTQQLHRDGIHYHLVCEKCGKGKLTIIDNNGSRVCKRFYNSFALAQDCKVI